MQKKLTNPSCFFTIVSKNYLPYARTLMASVKEHSPGADLVVIICDKVDSPELENDNFDILPIADLDIPDFDEFTFQYTILELNTAVKPFAFEYLFKKLSYSKVIYFDPDIRVYGSLQGLLDYLDDYQVVITPHLTGPLNDGLRPDETDILKAGSYNLGFIALSNGEESRHLLSWWSNHLRKECIVDVANGVFVDQKWIDLVPGMYQSVKINRDPGWNTAYWNLLHRKVTKNESEYFVNDSPLTFFHFSGVKAKEKIFSIHQNRYQYDSLPNAIRELVDDYIDQLGKNDADQISSSPYTYGSFDDGTPIPDAMRYAYRKNVDDFSGKEKFSLSELQPWVIQMLNKPADIGGVHFPYVTSLGYEIYSLRYDLKSAFPNLAGGDALAYATWYIATASRDLNLPESLINVVRNAVFATGVNPSGHSINHKKPYYGLGKRIFIKYKQYPHFNNMVIRLIPREARDKIRKYLLKQPGKQQSLPTGTIKNINPDDSTAGINVFGYLHAESGTGEAVRSTLRALKTSTVSVSAIDIRLNNVSRMEEQPPVEASQEQKHDINLFHINADQAPVILENLGNENFTGHYNIGFWFWELPLFPSCFNDSFNKLDEIWVASSFCQNAISQQSPVPVVNIPLCIDLDVPKNIDRSALGLPQEGFIFLSIMDLMSIPERKNPVGVLEAFIRAFPKGSKDVYLVLKLSNMDRCPANVSNAINNYLHHPNIIVLDRYFQRAEINALLNVADCYFAMHRAEGFGLPIAESMHLGKPVIATGWSSNMDFMNINNSMPLKYELVELDRDHGPYEEGNVWAEPDIDHAVECLKRVYLDKGLRQDLGKRAVIDIQKAYSPSAVGEKIRQRLELIGKY